MKHLHKDIDWTIFEFLEGNLSLDETAYVKQLIASDSVWQKSYSTWKLSYLEADLIEHPNKNELYKHKIKKNIGFKNNIQWYIAASLFMALTWYFGNRQFELKRIKTASTEASSSIQNRQPVITYDQENFGSQNSPDAPNLAAMTLDKKRVLSSSHYGTPNPNEKAIENYLIALNNPAKFTVDTTPRIRAVDNAVIAPPPSKEESTIYTALTSFFPTENKKEATLEWTSVKVINTANESYHSPSPATAVIEMYIDTHYFQKNEPPRWQQIWQHTKNGQFPAIKLAVESNPNSWIPNMNVNFHYP